MPRPLAAAVDSHLLVRVPIAPLDSATSSPFDALRELVARRRAADDDRHAAAAALIARLEAAIPKVTDRAARRTCLAAKRTLHRGGRIAAADQTALASAIGPAVALDTYVAALALCDTLEQAEIAAFQAASDANEHALLQRYADAPLRDALALSHPRLARQVEAARAEKLAPKARHRLARTLGRLFWRDIGRATPFGLHATTGVVRLGTDRSGGLPRRRLAASLRPDALDLPSHRDLSLAELERWQWQTALADPTQIERACLISEWRSTATAIARHGGSARPSESASHALFVESSFAGDIALEPDRVEPGLRSVARWGCDTAMPSTPEQDRRDRILARCFDGRGAMPLAVLASLFAEAGAAGRQEGAMSPAWPGPFGASLGDAAGCGIRLDENALGGLGRPLDHPRRACLRFKLLAGDRGERVIGLEHWGGDRMSFQPRYLAAPGRAFSAARQSFARWMLNWPEQAAMVPSPMAGFDRCCRVTRRRIVDETMPAGDGDVRWTDLTVEHGGCGALRFRTPAGAIVDPVYVGVRGWSALPRWCQVLLTLSAPAPSLIEAVIAAANAGLATRIARRVGEAQVLPRIRLGPHLEIVPRMLYLPRAAWEGDGTATLASARAVWRCCDALGWPAGLMEVRPAGRLVEPTILDLRDPAGLAWLDHLLAQAQAVMLVPIDRIEPLTFEGHRTIADFCCEVSTPRPGTVRCP